MHRFAFILMVISFFALTAIIPAMADPFSDVPQDHWAYDAVQMLEEKGLVEGYPDGLFKGDRPVTRYEMAMVVARVIAKLEQVQASIPEIPDLSIYATKEDMETINKLLKEFHDELDALGVRVVNIEDSVGKLTARVQELERIKLSGNFNTTAVAIGLSPGANNTTGPGTPASGSSSFSAISNPPGGPSGPGLQYGSDEFLGGFRLYQGVAVMSELNLNVAAKVAEKVKAGGNLEAYSTFGEKGISDMWGLVPPYNSTGRQPTYDLHFQANLSSLWFDTDGDWDVTGKYGDYTVSKVSSSLFVGPRALYAYGGTVRLPLNGLNFAGNLYKTVDFEAFTANNINSVQGFLNPDNSNTGSLYLYGNADHRHPLSNPTWYPLAVPYNDGAGSSHFLSYGQVDRGMYDNHMQGFWAGRTFCDDRAHIEGAYLRVYEDYASHPDVFGVGIAPKDTNYFGINGYYIFGDDIKIKVLGEFNQTRFDYNLLDNSNSSHAGSFFSAGAEADFGGNVKVYGKFLRIDANYDPFSFHRTWEKGYGDGLHAQKCCSSWKYGLLANPTRSGELLPNRTGIDIGADWVVGEEKQGHIYGDFTYLKQVVPTQITNDENSFQKYDMLNPLYFNQYNSSAFVPGVVGANIYGNQDLVFTDNDSAKGDTYIFEIAGHYSFGKNLHVWADYERYNFKREFDTVHTTSTGIPFTRYDVHFNYLSTGATYDITDKLSVQGNFAYVSNGGEKNGANVDWKQFIPGCGIKYDFSANTHILLDYKYYSYSDDATSVAGANDYTGSKLMTRLVINF